MNAIPLTETQMLEAMSSAMASGFEHLVPLFSAALTGKIQLFILPRGAAWPARELRQSKLPALVIIGDDDHNATGPDGWPAAIRDFARRAMIHAASGSIGTYKMALEGCVASRRYALVETSSAKLKEWVDFFSDSSRCIPLEVVRTEDGVRHPVLPS